MAIKGAVRYKPSVNSSLEATVAGLDTTATPPSGIVVVTAQLVAYDDTKVGIAGNPYVPGDPATEKFVKVVYQDAIQMSLEAFDGLSMVAAQALWTTALTNWKNTIGTPAALTLYTAVYGALTAAPILY
jgi:hypothetical protein